MSRSRISGLEKIAGLVRRALARWHWSERHQKWTLRVTRFGRPRATVAPNGTWHTWDAQGTGGYNSVVDGRFYVHHADVAIVAKRDAFGAAVEQGFL